jgi:2-haloacid dehalogenase
MNIAEVDELVEFTARRVNALLDQLAREGVPVDQQSGAAQMGIELGRSRACVFDAYGTLLDVHSAIRHYGALGSRADLISRTWRTKQLEYAWVRSLSGQYADFWECTTSALDFALDLHGADRSQRDALLDAYRTLDPYADAFPALQLLRAAGIGIAVLSNGTGRMLAEAFRSAKLTEMLDICLSIEAVGQYKPSPAAYALAARELGLKASSIGFISSNAWDVAGARAFGFVPVWVSREDCPDEYGLRDTVFGTQNLTSAADYLAVTLQPD